MSSHVKKPTLSIVVPVVGDVASLEDTLVSVLENRPDDSEIVVPLGCDYDDPWNIREEVRFVQAPRGSGLVACTNLGVASAAGRVVHVLASGWRATPGWADAALAHFAAPAPGGFASGDIAAVVPVAVAHHDPERVTAAGIRLSRGGRRSVLVPPKNSKKSSGATRVEDAVARLQPTGPLLEAGFWRADVLAMVGPGFAVSCGGWCDADMASAVECIGGRVVLEPAARVVGPTARRASAFGDGLQAERTFWRSLGRGSVAGALGLHLVEVVRDALARAPLGTVPAVLGRLAGLVQFGNYVPRLHQLRSLAEAVAWADENDHEVRTLRIDGAEPSWRGPSRSRGRSMRRSA
jgi:hypothetical protein